jgi:hypothetical protein
MELEVERRAFEACLAELPDASVNGRLGLGRFVFRWSERVICFALLTAIAHDVRSHASPLVSRSTGTPTPPAP